MDGGLPTDTPTVTPLPSDTPTATNTATPTDTPTVTPTPSDTPTPDGVPTTTFTPTNTPTAISTPIPTDTPTPTPVPTVTATPTDVPTTLVLLPVADTYVYESKPDTNYGDSADLRTDGSPDTRSYLRFDVQGLSGTVTSATLRINANTPSSVGFDVRRVSDNNWTELGLTYLTAPPPGELVGSSGPITPGAWMTVDVTLLVTGNDWHR
jgi:hypothetical protein